MSFWDTFSSTVERVYEDQQENISQSAASWFANAIGVGSSNSQTPAPAASAPQVALAGQVAAAKVGGLPVLWILCAGIAALAAVLLFKKKGK